jgi:hypothetical protein
MGERMGWRAGRLLLLVMSVFGHLTLSVLRRLRAGGDQPPA